MRPINRVLVANRGEIARRIIRACREMGIATVAVYSDADRAALFAREADLGVHLAGNAPTDTYLRGDLLIDAARRTGCDAVHPGYGFLSENAGFAAAVNEAGLVWVGPSPTAIDAMGSKVRAKALMVEAGVPTLPSAEVTGLSEADLIKAAVSIGFPLLVKASAGGGGRGMRLVRQPAELAEAVLAAAREAQAAFGDGTVFLERYIERARHIEIQVLGDEFGNLVSLFERDCTLQRRHQKVIEEAPSPSVQEPLRSRLSEAALRAARAVDYVGAGTVEFVLSADDAFYFLEMNTRLQVEHPVTELVTGVDIVHLQFAVAAGMPLPMSLDSLSLTGHAIEARLYAEDVPAGFLPSTGRLARFAIPDGPGIRVDAGVETDSVVSIHYDPMLAKVICHAPTRQQAIATLSAALAHAEIHGLQTNRDFLVRMLRSDAFGTLEFDTAYLDRSDPQQLGSTRADTPTVALHAFAAALAGQAARRAAARVLTEVPSGWRNVGGLPRTAIFLWDSERLVVTYEFARDGLRAAVNDLAVEAPQVLSASSDRVDVEVAGVRHLLSIHSVGDRIYVDGAGVSTEFVELSPLPEPAGVDPTGSMVAPMPGTIVRILVSTGASVTAGDVLLVMEAMKMEHPVKAPIDGVVEVLLIEEGEQVDAGTALVTLR